MHTDTPFGLQYGGLIECSIETGKYTTMHKLIKAMIFNLDDTVYSGDETIPGVADFMKIPGDIGIDVRFYTNRVILTPGESMINRTLLLPPPLLLNGIELDGKGSKGSCYHVVCLGSFQGDSKRV